MGAQFRNKIKRKRRGKEMNRKEKNREGGK